MLNKEDILALAWERSEGSGKHYIFTEESLFDFLKELKKEQVPARDEQQHPEAEGAEVVAEAYSHRSRDEHARTINHLRDEVEALRKDAERYRFLCDPEDADEDSLAHAVNTLNAWADKSEIDQAIDDAMAAKEENKTKNRG